MDFLRSIINLTKKSIPAGSLSRNATLVVLGDGIIYSSSIITTMILARLLPITDMATYRQVLYLGPLAQLIVDFGFSGSVFRFWNLLEVQKRGTFLKMCLIFSVILGAVAALSLAGLAPFLAALYHNPELKGALWICAAYPVINIVPRLVRPVMICRQRPLVATFFQVVLSLTDIFALIVPYYLGTGLFKALGIWMIVSSLGIAATLIILRHDFQFKTLWWDKGIFKDMWDYLWPLQVASIPGIMSTYTDKIATSIFLSKEAFAAYSLGARELPFIGSIGNSVTAVIIPGLVQNIAAGNPMEAFRRWKRACERTSILTYPIVGFCIWFALPLVQLIYSSKYKEASIPFAVFAAITYIRVISFHSLAKAFGQTKIIMAASLLSLVVMFTLSVPLTLWFNVWGISFAVFVSILSSAVYLLWKYTRIFKVSLSVFFPWKRLLTLAGLSILSAFLAGLLLDPFLHLSINPSILVVAVKLAAMFAVDVAFYFILLVITRIVPIETFTNLFKSLH